MTNHDMMTWSVVAAAIAFVGLCIYAIRVLMKVKHSLTSIESTAEEAKAAISVIRHEVMQISRSANEVSADVQDKLRAADPMFEAVREAGLTVRTVVGSVREAASSFSRDLLHEAGRMILFHLFGERVTKRYTAKEERTDENIREAGEQRG